MNFPNYNKVSHVLATCFGVGSIPFAPGTWGSLVAIPIGWVVIEEFGNISLLLIALGVFIIGVWASGQFAKNRKNADPSSCIIDEVAGQLTVLSFFANDPLLMLFAFLTSKVLNGPKPFIGSLPIKKFLVTLIKDTNARS